MNESAMAGRLITKNLLFSAEAAIRGRQQKRETIADLSSLINLMVLHDDISILGRGDRYKNSEVFDWVSEENKLHNVYVETDALFNLAKMHLGAYFGEERADMFSQMLKWASLSNDDSYGYVNFHQYDGPEDLTFASKWINMFDEEDDIIGQVRGSSIVARRLKFLMRTFLYMAYTDQSSVPFTPDAIRAPLVEHLVEKQETTIRGQLSQAMQRQFLEYPKIGDREIRSLTTPFAAIVFQRCKGNRKRILKETIRLRNELEDTRARLSDIERRMLLFSRDESIEAQAQWSDILHEIERSFGVEPNLVSFKRGISFSKEVGEVVDSPKSWKAWLDAFALLPVDVLSRLYCRRPVFEIHNLRQQLPGPNKLSTLFTELFGKTQTVWKYSISKMRDS